jgi:hypothetical protein
MPKDLVILVADSDMRAAVEGLLQRPPAIPIRPINYDLIVHPQRDPGVRLRSRELLAPFKLTNSYAIVLLDHEGCGTKEEAAIVENEIEDKCSIDWGDRIRAVAISPELEAWVWSDSPHVDSILGWSGRNPNLRRWLVDQAWAQNQIQKPSRPKEAFDAAIRAARKPRSATLFKALGASVGLDRCSDAAFRRFRNSLQMWFPVA